MPSHCPSSLWPHVRPILWCAGASLWELIRCISAQLRIQWPHFGSLKLATVGIFTPQETGRYYKPELVLFAGVCFSTDFDLLVSQHYHPYAIPILPYVYLSSSQAVWLTKDGLIMTEIFPTMNRIIVPWTRHGLGFYIFICFQILTFLLIMHVFWSKLLYYSGKI